MKKTFTLVSPQKLTFQPSVPEPQKVSKRRNLEEFIKHHGGRTFRDLGLTLKQYGTGFERPAETTLSGGKRIADANWVYCTALLLFIEHSFCLLLNFQFPLGLSSLQGPHPPPALFPEIVDNL